MYNSVIPRHLLIGSCDLYGKITCDEVIRAHPSLYDTIIPTQIQSNTDITKRNIFLKLPSEEKETCENQNTTTYYGDDVKDEADDADGRSEPS